MTAPVQTGTPATGTPAPQAAGTTAAPQQNGAPADRSFPQGTPLEQMTTEQQVAYWRHHARKHEQRAAQAPTAEQLAELQAKAARLDEVERAQMSELEKATAKIADLEAKVTAAGLTEMRRQACRDAGLPESDHVFLSGATTAAAAKEMAEQLKQRSAPTGATHDQGVRRTAPTSGREQGLAEAQRRFGTKTT